MGRINDILFTSDGNRDKGGNNRRRDLDEIFNNVDVSGIGSGDFFNNVYAIIKKSINGFIQKNKNDMPQVFTLKWLITNIIGGGSFLYTLGLSIYNLFFADISIPFESISKPWQWVVLFLGSVWVGVIVWRMIIVNLSSMLDYKWKSFDLKIRIAASAKIATNGILLSNDLTYFNEIKKCVDDIFAKTKADRFLILVATNGKDKMKFSSVQYEEHKETDLAYLSINAAKKYVKMEFDDVYEKMIKESEKTGYINMIVDAMEECWLKEVYQTERLTHSQLFFLRREKLEENKDEIYYCTIATHYGFFSPAEHEVFKNNVQHIKDQTNKIFQLKN